MALGLGVEIPGDQLAGAVRGGFGRIPERLDAAGVGYAVFGADRSAPVATSPNPALTATVFARRTGGLGLVAAASPQRDHPYNIARRTASLDHIAGGRAGWLALRADHGIALGAPAHGTWANPVGESGGPAELDAAWLADAVTAARALWRTWPFESLADEIDGRAPELEVRYADHTGIFPTTGPLNVPTTPQGEPVVFWEHRPGDERHAAVADVAFVHAREHAAARLPERVAVHVRVDAAELASRAADLVDGPHFTSGVLVRVDLDGLDEFTDRTLPALADSGLIRPRAGEPTLRDYLRLPRRADPDPLGLRPVFAERQGVSR